MLWTILWIIIVGFVAGTVARWIMPGRHSPRGFILTTLLGIVGGFLATWVGQATRRLLMLSQLFSATPFDFRRIRDESEA
jgi:uncharacterized membrane protein YeaQ/YmgE (transglycosylase-associated protein family)